MRKFLISLITIFTSLISMLGISNSALANPVVKQELKPIASDIATQPVQLNVTASLWQLGDSTLDSSFKSGNSPNALSRNPHKIFAHLGCSCADCSQTIEKNTELTIL